MKKKQTSSFFATLEAALVLFFLFCMILNPAKFIAKSLEGISAWAFNVLPSVLPFMFFTKILFSIDLSKNSENSTKRGIKNHAEMEEHSKNQTVTKLSQNISKQISRIFGTPAISLYVFFMAILSGYPVGSKMVADMFMQGKITRLDAIKMTSFCSTSGPMFITGAVGVGMFGSAKIGYILFFSHIFGAILNGITFRNFKPKFLAENVPNKKEAAPNTQQKMDLSEIVTNSVLSVLSVGCIVTIFFIVIECFSPLFSLLPQNLAYFCEGLVEITKGCLDISTLKSTFLATTLSSFVISFGGISTILQSLTMLSKVEIPVKLFVFQKFLHAAYSLLICTILCFVFGV